jgi:hypothetical protein
MKGRGGWQGLEGRGYGHGGGNGEGKRNISFSRQEIDEMVVAVSGSSMVLVLSRLLFMARCFTGVIGDDV